MSFRYPLLVLLSLCTSLPLWGAQDPPTVFPPAGYEGFPTLAADDGRFAGVSQGLNTLGTGSASFSVCVDPQGGAVTHLDLWGFDLDHGNPGNATATVASFWDLENMTFGNDDLSTGGTPATPSTPRPCPTTTGCNWSTGRWMELP